MHSARVRDYSIDVTGIDECLRDVGKVYSGLNAQEAVLLRSLSAIGLVEARARWSEAYLEDINGLVIPLRLDDITVEYTQGGFKIIASGEDVCFVEFGAGVHYNGGGKYLGQVPNGIAGIGQFGQGKGKRNTWGFKRGDEVTLTHGNPAFMPMHFTAETLLQKLETIAKEVFS